MKLTKDFSGGRQQNWEKKKSLIYYHLSVHVKDILSGIPCSMFTYRDQLGT